MTDSIASRLWHALAQAATARSPFNFLQLATVGGDGSPQLRTIVLRRCDAAGGGLSFVTDIRSPKAREIEQEPRVSLVGFDPGAMIQVRLSGNAFLVADDSERRTMWESLRGRTLVLFEAPLPPGTAIDDEGRALAVDPPTQPDDPFERFALVGVRLSRLEWLDLSAPEHARYVVERSGEGWKETRLAP